MHLFRSVSFSGLPNLFQPAMTILFITLNSGCNNVESTSKTPSSLTPTSPSYSSLNTPSSPSYTPDSPSPLPTEAQNFTASCSTDTSEILSAMSNPPLDPLLAANSMVFTIEKSKQILTQISSDERCVAEKNRLTQALQSYWHYYITQNYQADTLLANTNKMSCEAGCNLYDDSSNCRIGCEETYQGVIKEAQTEQQSKVKEMTGFFASIR